MSIYVLFIISKISRWYWKLSTACREILNMIPHNLTQAKRQKRERKGNGALPHLWPDPRLPHGHAVLALAALGRGRLRPGAVSLPGSDQSAVAQLLRTGHLSALHPFSTSSWTWSPFCHHPPTSKARATETHLKISAICNCLGSSLRTSTLNSTPHLCLEGSKAYARKVIHEIWYLYDSCQ